MTRRNMSQPAIFFRSIYPVIVLRLLIGSIFIFSAISKLPVHSQFISIVETYNILPQPLATAYALAVPWLELLAGSYILLGIQIRLSSIITLLLAFSFLVANISSAISGESLCGSCFGEIIILSVSQALILDIGIIVATVYVYIVGRQPYSFDNLFAFSQH